MNTNTEPTPLPCPFCGSEAWLKDCNEDDPSSETPDEILVDGWLCGCGECDIMFFGPKEKVITRWNTRVNITFEIDMKDIKA